MSYAAKLVSEAARSRQKSVAGRDIAPIPPVDDAGRRAAAEGSLRLFCETYFPQTFYLPWSDDHLSVIAQLERVIIEGGLFAVGMPRGSGKTNLIIAATEWAILCGHRRFIIVIGSSETGAVEMMEMIKGDCESNELLAADFPEALYPIHRLEGIAHRANGQLLNGDRTHIDWTADQIVFPTVPHSHASGAIVRVAGITGRIRGMTYRRADGATVRPDLVLLDDPQTDESANSPAQCAKREAVIKGAVLGLAGPSKKIAALATCTVIREGDLADTLLSREKSPDWQGQRYAIASGLPTNKDLWEKYAELRSQGMRDGGGTAEATAFYAANRAAMDEGCVPAWSDRKEPDEISAVQNVMNLKLRDESSFWAEYMNQPKQEEKTRPQLTADELAGRLSGTPRGVVPDSATRLTCFIDVQGTLLYWVVCAWEDNFTGVVIDYGTYPDQRRAYFTLADAKRTLQSAAKTKDTEQAIYTGLQALLADVIGRDWHRADGGAMRIDRTMIDANWGQVTDVVYRFARWARDRATINPCHGRYVRASQRSSLMWRTRPGDRGGTGWRMPKPTTGKTRYVAYDVNHWKTFAMSKFAIEPWHIGSLTLFGDDPATHRMIGDQLASEYATRIEVGGDVFDEWSLRPGRPDNHLWDGVVGCVVGAAIEGVSSVSIERGPKRRKISLSELQQRRRRVGV